MNIQSRSCFQPCPFNSTELKAILPLLPGLSQACITSRNPESLWEAKCQDQESGGLCSGTSGWEGKMHLERTTAGDVNP